MDTYTPEEMAAFEKQYGSIDWKGQKYILTDQAVADNYGTEGAVRYYADAIGENGEEYHIAWDTTEEWDMAQERDWLRYAGDLTAKQERRLAVLEDMPLPDVSDESNACDWGNPVEVWRV